MSPAVVHLRANVLVVDPADRGHRIVREGGQVGGGAVFGHLLRPLGAGNRAGHGVEHQNPAQCELRERPPGRANCFHFLHGAEARFVVDAGKRFADVERLAVAVELAVIGRFELRVATQLAGEQSGGQRHAGQDADFAPLALRRRTAPPADGETC